MSKAMSVRAIVWFAIATAILTAVVLVQVFRGAAGPETVNPAVQAAAFSAASVLLVAFLLPGFIRRFDLEMVRWLPWSVGGVSALLSLVPWWLVAGGYPEWASAIYRGLRLPQGIEQFWDLALVLRSVDCASYGIDVYAANNGCLQDPSIYGPGTLWLQYAPFDLFSARFAPALGVIAILVSSLVLVWLARFSSGRGALVLLVAAVGAPWLLLLERGNFDAFVIWVAAGSVLLVRRWNSLWMWSLAASGIWLMGTWKYYPFAMGLMLIPLLRIKRGWIVLVAYLAASLAFVAVTWENFRFSASSNAGMVDLGDVVVLGRIPLVSRMFEAQANAASLQAGDLLVYGVAVLALVWGVVFALALGSPRVHEAMLAIAGSSMFLISVLVSGFGYAYKAAFLLLAVPLLGRPARPGSRAVLYSSIVMLSLIAVNSTVVWNTILATLAGIIAASFAFGAAAATLARLLVGKQLPQGERPGLGSGNHAVTG